MVSIKNFNETEIFRCSSLLLRTLFSRVKNVELDIKRTICDDMLHEIGNCVTYTAVSWNEHKENKVVKLVYMVKARREIYKAEGHLNLIVSSGLFPGKRKSDETNEMYLNGGSEVSKNIAQVKIQLDSLIKSLESSFTEEELTTIYSDINTL